MLTDSEVAELLSFLTIGTRPDVKDQAIGYLLGLSGNRWEANGDDGGDINNNNKGFEFIAQIPHNYLLLIVNNIFITDKMWDLTYRTIQSCYTCIFNYEKKKKKI